MSELVALVHDDRATAEQARAKLVAMRKEYIIEIDDIVIAERTEKGKIKLHQAVSLVGRGALEGGFLGTLIGLIFLNPLFGLVVGAGFGAVGGALADFGIDDDYMKRLAEHLDNGKAILFVLLRKEPTDKAIAAIGGLGGEVLTTSLATDDEQRLREVTRQAELSL